MEKKENRKRILKIGKIKKAMSDFAKQRKELKQGKTKQYKNKRKQIQEQFEKLKEKGNTNNNAPWGEISDFGDEEFYGFVMILNESKKNRNMK